MFYDWEKALKVLSRGGVAVLPTDTIYGLHCLAFNKASVEKVYDIKGRDFTKPFIILISSQNDLKEFGIIIDATLSKTLDSYWPGPNSMVLPVTSDRFKYLHRGGNSLAFRVPNYPPLLNLLKQTGPLVSTSANPSGKEPATDTIIAREYFGNLVDYYLDAGTLNSLSSKVFKFTDGKMTQLR